MEGWRGKQEAEKWKESWYIEMMFFLSFDCIWKLFFKYLFVTKSVGNTLLNLAKLI